MKAKEILFEMPRLVSGGGALEFARKLDNAALNQESAERFLALNPEVIRQDDFGKLYLKEIPAGGVYMYVSDETDMISYYMNYQTKYRERLGDCATQVAVWASLARGMINITAYVFFDIMLKRFDTIVSDEAQSTDGRRFWIRRMIDSLEKGLTVGIIDHGKIKVFDASSNFQDWLASLDAWGYSKEHQKLLFFISNKKVV